MTTVADLELRPATLDDAAIVADIDTETHPGDPVDPVIQRHWWSIQAPDDVADRSIAVLGGAPVGYATREHPAWSKMPERFTEIGANLRPPYRDAARFNALFAMLEAGARADDTLKLTAWAWEHDALLIEVLAGRGFTEERRERFWELDLVAGRERITAMAEASRDRMRREGITVLTLAEDTDPAKFEKLKRMSDEAEADVPSSEPFVPLEMREFMEWFASPGLRADRIWLAREADDIIGISQLSYPPVRGVVSTDWTGMARRARGRGIARALKCETLMQAIALGVDRVRTDNDSANAPILHINESMGYVRRPDAIQLLKAL
jgi:GNAT superfamily N-acetyltransferase